MANKPTYEELEKRVKVLEKKSVDRKKSESALSTSEERFLNLFSSCPMGIFLYKLESDGALIFKNANQAADDILGVSCHQFIGKTIEEAFPPLCDTEVPARYRDAAAKGKMWKTEKINYTHGGISGAFKVVAFQTKPNEMACIFEDITERKRAEESLRKAHDELEKRIEKRTAAVSKLNEQLNMEIDERKLSEEALRESEKTFHDLFDLSPLAIALTELKTGKVIDVNEIFCELTKYAKEQVLGRTSTELGFYSIENRNRFKKELEESGKVHGLEIEFKLKDGSMIDALMFSKLIGIAGEKVVITVFYDLSERRRAEEALRKSEAKFRNLAESLDEIVYRAEPGTFEPTYVNKAIERIYGYTVKEWLDNPWLWQNLIFPEDKERVLRGTQRSLKRTENLHLEYRMKRKDGNTCWVEDRVSFEKDQGGKVVSVNGVVYDITERKCIEEELRQSEKRYRDLVETINDVIWEVDTNGTYTYLSPRVKDILGYEAKELLGEPFTERMTSYETGRVSDIFMEIVAEPKPFMALETTPIRKNGFTIVLENSGKPFFSTEGKLLGFRGAYRDITERKRAEELIRDLSHQLLKAQENERQTISRELHDTVAQDLSSSNINCEMLLKYKSLTPGIRKKISEISDGLRNTLMTVRDLSYHLRPPGLERLGLARTLYEFCKDYSEKTGIKIDFHSAGIDELDLNYETKINLYRLVQEGLNNVRKHAYASKVAVKLVSSFPNIILRIEDDGKGFDLKKRLAKTAREKRLGLRSMQERANLLQGRMDIKSISGKGTKIFITVPYSKENIGAKEDHIDH